MRTYTNFLIDYLRRRTKGDNMFSRAFPITLMAFTLLASSQVSGLQIYVDGTLASDCTVSNYSITNRACNGSDGDAYNTIQKGVDVLVAGDTLHLRAGTYRAGRVQVGSDGTQAAPVTIQSYLNETVNLKPPTPGCDVWNPACGPFFQMFAANWVIFDGLNFDGEFTSNCPLGSACEQLPNRTGYSSHMGIFSHGLGSNITVSNCEFQGFAHAGLKGDIDGWLIEYNHFHDIGLSRYDHAFYSVAGSSGTFRYNRINGIAGYGVHSFSNGANSQGAWDVYYNIFRNYGTDPGNFDAACIVSVSSDLTFVGNVCDDGSQGVFAFNNNLDNWYVANNIIMNQSFYDIFLTGSNLTNSTFINNYYSAQGLFGPHPICSGCAAASAAFDDIPPNLTGTVPTFVVATPTAWHEYRSAAGSIVIDAGVTLSSVFGTALDPTDTTWPPSLVNQSTNGSGWEIGPFVHLGSPVIPPSAPQNLRGTP